MAHVLLHLNVPVPNRVAEKDENEAIEWAKHKVAYQPRGVGLPDLDKWVALAEVVDFDE